MQSEKGHTLPNRTIIDVDVHTAYRTEQIREKIASRLDEPYKSYLTRESAAYVPYPRDSFPKNSPQSKYYTEERGAINTPEDIQEDLCKEMGIDIAILSSLQKFDVIPQTERAIREMRAVNDVLLDHFLQGHSNLFGLLMLTTKDPDRAAEEIDRLGDHDDIVGAMILNGASDRPLGDPIYDPIYRSAENKDLPIVFHTSSVSYVLARKFPFLFNDLQKYVTLHTLSHPFAGMTTVASLMMNGVPAKFPDLSFVFLEVDLGTVPLISYRMNREAQERSFEIPLLEKSPEEYLREQFYWGTQPLPEPQNLVHARHIIDSIGPDNIMFSTDHPHPDFDSPEWVVDRYFGHLSLSDQNKVLYKNAANVFNIEV